METGSEGVISAETTRITTKATFRPFLRILLFNTPSEDNASTSVGNSKASPISNMVDVNTDIYDPMVMLLVI